MIDYSTNSGHPGEWWDASKTFHKWWNPDKFDWRNSWALCEFCSDQIEIWWDADKFDWNDSWRLCGWCSDKIEIWFDAEKFNWEASYYLKKYCSKYESIWGPDYIMKEV